MRPSYSCLSFVITNVQGQYAPRDKCTCQVRIPKQLCFSDCLKLPSATQLNNSDFLQQLCVQNYSDVCEETMYSHLHRMFCHGEIRNEKVKGLKATH